MRIIRPPIRFFLPSLLLGVLVLLSLLGSCGRVDTSRRIILWEQMDPKEQEEYDKNLATFQETHPEFAEFRFERVHYRPEDLQTQFQTAALAYGGPSLVYGPADKIGVYAIMGLLMPVNDLLPQSELDRFDQRALPIIDGLVYGLPDNVGNHLTLVANMALVDTIATNTDDWLRQLHKTTVDADGDGKPEQYGLVFNLLEPFWLVPWLGGFGGWVMDDEFQPTLDTEAMRGALGFLKQLKDEGVVPLECDYPLADTIFSEGRAAYIINGPWSWQGYREAGIDIRLAPIPMVSETGLWPTPMTSAKCYSINRYLNKETYECTKALLEFMTSRQVQLGLARTLSVQPSDLIARSDPDILSDPTLRASRDQIEKGRLMPIVPEMRAIWDAMRPSYQSVINGELTPDKAAARMQEKAATMIERMRE